MNKEWKYQSRSSNTIRHHVIHHTCHKHRTDSCSKQTENWGIDYPIMIAVIDSLRTSGLEIHQEDYWKTRNAIYNSYKLGPRTQGQQS